MASDESWRAATFSGRRITVVAGALVMVGAMVELVAFRSIAGAASLTGAGGVAIINFRWLEAVIQRAVQAGSPKFDRKAVLLISGRMLLFAGMMAALLWVPHIDPVALALGFSALVVALLIEGFRWARVGGG
jgi:hypothetical protein